MSKKNLNIFFSLLIMLVFFNLPSLSNQENYKNGSRDCQKEIRYGINRLNNKLVNISEYKKIVPFLKKYYKNKNSCFNQILLYKKLIPPQKILDKKCFIGSSSFEYCKHLVLNNSWFYIVDYSQGAEKNVHYCILDSITGDLAIFKNNILDLRLWYSETFFPTPWEWALIKCNSNCVEDLDMENCRPIPCYFPPVEYNKKVVFEHKKDKDRKSKLWAVVICGIKNSNTLNSADFDAKNMYALLKAYCIKEDRIYYFNPNDNHPNKKFIWDDKLVCQIKEEVNKKLEGKVNYNDKLLIYISTHGSSDGIEIPNPPNNKCRINASTFATWLTEFKAENIYVIICACYGNNFIEEIKGYLSNSEQNIVLISASNYGQNTFGDFDNGFDVNKEDKGDEFLSGFLEAFLKDKKADQLDENGEKDGKISLCEAYQYAITKCITCEENYYQNMCYIFYTINRIAPALIELNGSSKKAFLFWD